jgi:hypothetical protein
MHFGLRLAYSMRYCAWVQILSRRKEETVSDSSHTSKGDSKEKALNGARWVHYLSSIVRAVISVIEFFKELN